MTPIIRSILLAEDSPADAEMAIDALREAHLANPSCVEDGIEALDYLLMRGKHAGRAEGAAGGAAADIKMPRMDGLEVLRQLRGDERFKRLPVVVLTSSREETDLPAAGTSGRTPTWSSRWT